MGVSPLEVVCKKLAERLRKMFGIGELPKDYNPKVHGPYDPAIYYGPRDKAFGDVKISELPGWLARRSKTPVGMGRAMSRAYWRWSHNMCFPSTRAWHQAFSLLLGGLHYGTFSTLPNTGNIEITNISGKRIENL